MANEFAFDILWTLRELQVRCIDKKLGTYTDAVARFTLVQMGLSTDEVNEIDELFTTRVNANSLGTHARAVERIAVEVNENDHMKEMIVSALAATHSAQYRELTQSEEQVAFVKAFKDVFDMKQSQFQQALNRGMGWEVGLVFVAEQYMEWRRE